MTPSSKRGILGSNALWNPDDDEVDSGNFLEPEISVTVESVTPIQGVHSTNCDKKIEVSTKLGRFKNLFKSSYILK